MILCKISGTNMIATYEESVTFICSLGESVIWPEAGRFLRLVREMPRPVGMCVDLRPFRKSMEEWAGGRLRDLRTRAPEINEEFFLDPSKVALEQLRDACVGRGPIDECDGELCAVLGCDVALSINDDEGLIHCAARIDDVPFIYGALERRVDFTSSDVVEALADYGHARCLDKAIQLGYFVSDHAWGLAARQGHLPCLKVLARNRPTASSKQGSTDGRPEFSDAKWWPAAATLEAAKYGRCDCLSFLVDNGCSLHPLALSAAAGNGQLKCLLYVLDHLDFFDKRAKMTMATAAAGGHLACLKVLVGHNFELDSRALCEAARNRHAEVLRYLLSEYFLTEEVDPMGAIDPAERPSIPKRPRQPIDGSALVSAIEGGSDECFDILVAAGCPYSDAALRMAVIKKQSRCLHNILENFMELIPESTAHIGLVGYAAYTGSLENVIALMERGFPIWLTAIAEAAAAGQLACIEYLLPALKRQAPDDYDSACSMALERAACEGQLECMIALRKAGTRWTGNEAAAAAENGRLLCLAYIVLERELERTPNDFPRTMAPCPIDYSVCAEAASRGELAAMIFLHEHNCGWDEKTVHGAVVANNKLCLEYACEHDCPIGQDTYLLTKNPPPGMEHALAYHTYICGFCDPMFF